MWTQSFEGETHENNPFIPDDGEILMLWGTKRKYVLFEILIAAKWKVLSFWLWLREYRYDISEEHVAFVLKEED